LTDINVQIGGLPAKKRFWSHLAMKFVKRFNNSLHCSLLTGAGAQHQVALFQQKITDMKKLVIGAALLMVIGTTYARPLTKHPEERNILSSELPVGLQSDIKSAYAGYWITELSAEGEGKHVKYSLTLENADQVVHLRAGKSTEWEVVNTSVKAD
jgi:hypothetical protein